MSIPESHLAQEAIAALVDGELSGGAAGRAARHLAGCAQCRLAVSAQREAKAALQVPADVAVPGDLLSRLRAIPFTAEVPTWGVTGTLSAGGDRLLSTDGSASWSIPLAPPAVAVRPQQARWLRRGMTGALVGLGVGVAVLAVGLPKGGLPADDPPPPGSVAGDVRQTTADDHTADDHTDIVPPVVRTLTVGMASTGGATSGPLSGGIP